MAVVVCIECGIEPIGNSNMPFSIVEGEQCCALHVASRLSRLLSPKITKLQTDNAALLVDNVDLKARITALETK